MPVLLPAVLVAGGRRELLDQSLATSCFRRARRRAGDLADRQKSRRVTLSVTRREHFKRGSSSLIDSAHESSTLCHAHGDFSSPNLMATAPGVAGRFDHD